MADNDGNSAKRLTIYDLAQIAGTSPSAVSSVLNGTWKKRRISERLAERITRIAEEQGYAVNLQASVLRRERSRIVGMIIPKYDNRYFGAIAEQFEAMARARGLFPVITCTRREAELEFDAARALVSYQAETLIVTGATEPDRIGEFCRAAGVRVINLDLPGSNMPSVVSDNFTGAYDLTRLILTRACRDFGTEFPLFFIGGRAQDHNTRERLRGFLKAHEEAGLTVPDDQIIMHGYAPEKNEALIERLDLPDRSAIFVNSTIALEGVVRALHRRRKSGPTDIRFGCFDWDPFAALMHENVGMSQQDVTAMLLKVFDLMEHPPEGAPQVLIPCIIRPIENGEEVLTGS